LFVRSACRRTISYTRDDDDDDDALA